MRTLAGCLFLALVAGVLSVYALEEHARTAASAEGVRQPMLAHMVYFTLNDASAEQQQKLVDACHKYLSNHEGVVFYAAGTLAQDFDRPVNDREFHVGLHVVFADKAAHDAYQSAPSHLQFIEENKANWKQVRVFDSYVDAPGRK